MGKKDKRVDAYIAKSADFANQFLSTCARLYMKAALRLQKQLNGASLISIIKECSVVWLASNNIARLDFGKVHS